MTDPYTEAMLQRQGDAQAQERAVEQARMLAEIRRLRDTVDWPECWSDGVDSPG